MVNDTPTPQKTAQFPCTRCGKPRIVAKTWKEEIKTFAGVSEVIHVDTICPDPECQKIVDAELAVKRAKQQAIMEKKNASHHGGNMKR